MKDAWTITAHVKPDFLWSFPFYYHNDTINKPEIEALLASAQLTNVSMLGCAATCHYNIELWGQAYYMTDFGGVGGCLIDWEEGCRTEAPHGPGGLETACWTDSTKKCDCSWGQPYADGHQFRNHSLALKAANPPKDCLL